ncbi:hypothetical protein D9619_006144 [Psilocybe cf. subviscida]|uniref:SET domain-containing protein n=1 Tax=Psilocybe cf. subviscida TaxID=2480587 RepID=A0A8H5EXY9_9AGAR|nr:hypothetical protein D9619_006144 [Psilocybe cf. subviscida]
MSLPVRPSFTSRQAMVLGTIAVGGIAFAYSGEQRARKDASKEYGSRTVDHQLGGSSADALYAVTRPAKNSNVKDQPHCAAATVSALRRQWRTTYPKDEIGVRTHPQDKMKPSQEGYKPSHAEFVVEFVPGQYMSSLKSRKAFKAGEVMAVLTGLTRGSKAYTTVQCGRNPRDHIELNSDLVYVNHSCEPNAAFDFSSPVMAEWSFRALKDIALGDTLTFFYPSTEWAMDQPFACQCKTKVGIPPRAVTCLGNIQGAKYLSKKDLEERIFVSPWILDLVAERDANPA